MTKHLNTPQSRLVCFGEARGLTNAIGQQGTPEPVFPLEYDL